DPVAAAQAVDGHLDGPLGHPKFGGSLLIAGRARLPGQVDLQAVGFLRLSRPGGLVPPAGGHSIQHPQCPPPFPNPLRPGPLPRPVPARPAPNARGTPPPPPPPPLGPLPIPLLGQEALERRQKKRAKAPPPRVGALEVVLLQQSGEERLGQVLRLVGLVALP